SGWFGMVARRLRDADDARPARSGSFGPSRSAGAAAGSFGIVPRRAREADGARRARSGARGPARSTGAGSGGAGVAASARGAGRPRVRGARAAGVRLARADRG